MRLLLTVIIYDVDYTVITVSAVLSADMMCEAPITDVDYCNRP